ncbi:MAG: TRAP transporter small permease [Candidatus Rokubacteria bacterium]|nr:TRAP transporter small permease [Candidatus Rokubacteria bacterium]
MQFEPPQNLVVLLVFAALSALGLTWVARRSWTTARHPTWQDVEAFLGLFSMLGMLYAAAIQVSVRYTLSEFLDLPWTEELARLLLVWTALWGAAILQRTDDHIAMTVVYDSLPARLQLAVRLLGDVVALVVLSVIAWHGWLSAKKQMIMTTVSLGMPISMFILPVALAATIMVVHTLVIIVRRLRGQPIRTWSPLETELER